MPVAPHADVAPTRGAALSRFGPLVFVAALIFTLSSFRGDELPMMRPPWAAYLPELLLENADKVAHFGVYAMLGAAGLWAWSRLGRRTAALFAILFCLAYGASDELHQAFVPGRMPDALDWLADGAGAAVGVALAASVLGRLAKGAASR